MEKEKAIMRLIKNGLEEDIGEADHTTLSTISPTANGYAVLKIKEDGILAGLDFSEKIFRYKEPAIEFTFLKTDGDIMQKGEEAFTIKASIHTILQCERLVLNCMQRMSGIATLTHKYVQKLTGYRTRLLDTRKTTPNFRIAEKEAVRIGGAYNHRMGLYDMIMLKDNHIDYCGGIKPAIEKAWGYVQQYKPGLQIEVETRSLDDVRLVIKTGKVNRIMLDNFTPAQISEALAIIDGQFETEASGGIDYNNLELYAATGVDFISSGAIIHQARSLDMSLKALIK